MRAALPCRPAPARAAGRREKRGRLGAGLIAILEARREPERMRLLVVPAVQMPIFPSETVHAVADQRIGDAGFHGRGQLGDAWSAKAD